MEKSLKIPLYDNTGKKKKDLSLNPHVFSVECGDDLLTQVILVYKSNKRRATASTKTRSEVRGGGRKPFRQKGTGRARAGSIRSPLWRGGGVIFGPSKERNYSRKVPQKLKIKALLGILSKKVAEGRFLVLDSLNIVEGKTKELVSILEKLPLKGTVLLALPEIKKPLKRASDNIAYLKVVSLKYINAAMVADYQYFVTSSEGIKFLENKYRGLKIK